MVSAILVVNSFSNGLKLLICLIVHISYSFDQFEPLLAFVLVAKVSGQHPFEHLFILIAIHLKLLHCAYHAFLA